MGRGGARHTGQCLVNCMYNTFHCAGVELLLAGCDNIFPVLDSKDIKKSEYVFDIGEKGSNYQVGAKGVPLYTLVRGALAHTPNCTMCCTVYRSWRTIAVLAGYIITRAGSNGRY